ncbi:MAG: hypothetical protein WA364_11665 [Candidatus Nitrosopolaris sp.]
MRIQFTKEGITRIYEPMEHTSIKIKSLRPAQVRGHGQIAVVEDTPIGADAYDKR